MLFKRKRRVHPNYERKEYADQAYASIEEEEQKAPEATMTTLLRREVVSYCEQMLDLSQEIEDTRAEYHLVTSYLKDIQILEEMSDEERQPISETAKKILSLNRSREEFLNADKKLSDSQYAMMEKEADQIAVVSLILGILSIMTSCIGYTMGLGIVGLLAANISKRIKREQNGMAIAGLITSMVGICFSMLAIIVLSFVYKNMNPEMLKQLM